jgi:hypothetical protein
MSDEEKQELFDQLVAFGYSASEAEALVKKKSDNYAQIKTIEGLLKIAQTVPVRFISNWDKMNERQRRDALWKLGINTRADSIGGGYAVDIQCYRWGMKVECGEVALGNERVDKSWVRMTVNGEHVASDEARFFRDRDTLEVLRGNKREF